MKRAVFILILIFFIMSLTSFAFAGGDFRYLETKYTGNAPDELSIGSFPHQNDSGPLEKFQNIIGFHLCDGEIYDDEFMVMIGTADDYKEYKLAFHLIYSKNDLNRYDDVFISGTFDYTERNTDTLLEEFSGDIIGQIVLINPNDHNLVGLNSDDVGAVVLRLSAPDEEFLVYFFLNPGGTGLLGNTEEPEPVSDYSEYYDYEHESHPHVPRPSNQTDVAVGVALSTAGIAAVNALSGTSIFGSASFNGSFNPTAPAPAPAAPAAQPPSGTSSGGVIGVIKDFFKNLFDSLRDMLSDEGRSYAGGKLAETLEDIVPDDVDNDV